VGELFHLAVNVSARQFHSSDFVAIVKSVLAETGFPAAALELEITESTLQATERSLLILKALKELGVAISIDDFGTGYSSLSVLRDLPINGSRSTARSSSTCRRARASGRSSKPSSH
jgi:EAL domain-containing protein (putative c-di-GMP-specific phosphodiesterase class I)